ncbi:MAG: serine/threonine protein kinase [Deltaproteobacteria bacterium]|nr:serine/threonine protein kinase [Deltaproteobacteria bacterium]
MTSTSSLTEFFYALTPERVMSAVELDGRRCTGRFIVLNSYENRVYQLEVRGAGDEEAGFVVGKFYRPGRWSEDALYDEHDFVDDLEDLEIPVVSALDLGDGEVLGDIEGIRYCVYPRVGGRAVEEPNDEQLRRLGFLIARIHAGGRVSDAEYRMELTPESYGWNNLSFLLDNDLVLPSFRDAYARTAEAVVKRIEPLWDDIPLQRIHGDCHLGNILWMDQGPTFLDFDDMVRGPVAQDLWLLFGGRDAWGKRRQQIVLEGYDSFTPFPRSQLKLMEPLRALRYIHFTAWLARRHEDPAFQVAFPHYGTEMYWNRCISDLREQLALIEDPPA